MGLISQNVLFQTLMLFFHLFCNYSPLGPFVPAPPEVAMQMFREQGGPTPFEGGGRNGRAGPAPIIASFPGLRQDPRRLRR